MPTQVSGNRPHSNTAPRSPFTGCRQGASREAVGQQNLVCQARLHIPPRHESNIWAGQPTQNVTFQRVTLHHRHAVSPSASLVPRGRTRCQSSLAIQRGDRHRFHAGDGPATVHHCADHRTGSVPGNVRGRESLSTVPVLSLWVDLLERFGGRCPATSGMLWPIFLHFSFLDLPRLLLFDCDLDCGWLVIVPLKMSLSHQRLRDRPDSPLAAGCQN
jgi:hypothetical protein